MRLYKRILCFLMAMVMLCGMTPMTVFAKEEKTEATDSNEVTKETTATEETEAAAVISEHEVDLDRLYNPIVVNKGALDPVYDGSVIDSDIYGYVVNYPLKKGHILSISDTNYVFSVRKRENGNYSTMLKQATTAKYTATEDMMVAMLIRKPDKSAITTEELANIVIYDSQFDMIGVEGSVKRFTVEAETIDGGTAATRAAIFLPDSYSETGTPTKLIVMTNGYSAHLTDSVWNKNSTENVQVIQNYLNADYAVWVVDNTAASTSQTPDLGCPQLVDSYFKAYEYIQNNLNVEKKFSVHSRSFGTFAAIRVIREHPELVKCAVMTGPRVSFKWAWDRVQQSHVANRFGFDDMTGATYEADKLVGYDPYTDVKGEDYDLPPTFWMMASGDYTAEPVEFIQALAVHGNDTISKTYSGINHTDLCALNTSETFADALSFLKKNEEKIAAIHLRYDDRYDLTGKTVEIIDVGTPTSYKVGYGVAEGTLDDAVITLDGNQLIATGIGTAKMRIDGKLYEVTVESAPISLILLAGQSNMQGIDGNAKESVVCPTGQVYATYADRCKKTVADVTKFAPSALVGEYSTVNVTGDTACLEKFPVNMLTEPGNGREGMDSGLAYEWVKQTGEKIWVINLLRICVLTDPVLHSIGWVIIPICPISGMFPRFRKNGQLCQTERTVFRKPSKHVMKMVLWITSHKSDNRLHGIRLPRLQLYMTTSIIIRSVITRSDVNLHTMR